MEIKPQELRIGNFIGMNLKEFPDNYFTVVELAEESAVMTEGLEWHPIRDREYFDPRDAEGIPLTTEWLERFGFEYAEGFADDYTKQPITVYNNPFKIGWTVENLFNQQIKEDILVLRYVHQLQNLYFALTGEELAIDKTSLKN